MKNILLVCSKLAEEQTGGVQTRIINYAKNLPKLGFNPTILSLANYSQQHKSNYFNIPINKFPKNKLFLILKFLYQKRKLIDCIHILEGSLELGQILLLFMGKIFNINTGISLYGGEVFDIKTSYNFKYIIKLWLVLILAKKIIVNSKATRKFIPKIFKNKIHIVYPGVNSELLQNKNMPPKNDDKINLLYVGRLIRRKGLDDIIKALKIVINKFENIKLLIVGKNRNMDVYNNLINKLSLSDYVEFKNEVHNLNELANYYANCDIFLMAPKLVYNPPGGFESFGCVYLEAGLFKKPVIGTKHFGVQEAVRDNYTGLLISENSPKEIAQAIFKLINNPDLRKYLGEINYKRTINNFMDIHSAKQLASVYK